MRVPEVEQSIMPHLYMESLFKGYSVFAYSDCPCCVQIKVTPKNQKSYTGPELIAWIAFPEGDANQSGNIDMDVWWEDVTVSEESVKLLPERPFNTLEEMIVPIRSTFAANLYRLNVV